MTQALFFDLDGILIDSSDNLTRALNVAFAEPGLGSTDVSVTWRHIIWHEGKFDARFD